MVVPHIVESLLVLVGSVLPGGPTPAPVAVPHFPDRLHAFVWRNWELVPTERLAQVVGCEAGDIEALGERLGLPPSRPLPPEQRERAAITVIRRNWHLLPYEQLLTLLGWTEEELAFALREDDFLYIKLGMLKPDCEPVRWSPPDAESLARDAAFRAEVRQQFPLGLRAEGEPLFGFIADLSAPPTTQRSAPADEQRYAPRYCYSYFALYGDALLDGAVDSYPDGYLARLAESGVDGVWLQAILYRLAPFPWEPERSARWEERLRNLGKLVERARKHGLGVWLYLNEPRAMPLSFFEGREELRGVAEGEWAAMCTSAPEVRQWLRDSVETVFTQVPGLAGAFTISGSENLTNCWSHYQGAQCPRCAERGPASVIGDYHAALQEGIAASGSPARLNAWDWGWQDAWAPELIAKLPAEVGLMSVSEWSIPIERGGVASVVGEYSISTVGPGPRASRHWALARERGMRTMAKLQIGNTWEIAATPWIPAVALVAEHLVNLRDPARTGGAPVDGLMLGWTLGGYPSPNLELAEVVGAMETPNVEDALRTVAVRRYGEANAPEVIRAWRVMSEAFRQYPYDCGLLYNGPMQYGPSNLLHPAPTGYRATMTGFPYDDLNGWRGVYPPEVFIRQFELLAEGFGEGADILTRAASEAEPSREPAIAGEARISRALSLHFRSCADQARFILARDALAAAPDKPAAEAALAELRAVLLRERATARALYALQREDSRIGFEASNHYFYTPLDLAEKVMSCTWLLEEWLPAQGARVAR